MKKILPHLLHLMLISFIISITQSAKAQINMAYTEGTDEQYSFVIWTNSGEIFNYLLSERPKVMQTASSLVLTTTKTEMEYPKDNVRKLTLSTCMEGGVESITCDIIGMTQSNNIVCLTNCRAGSVVSVYSVSGVLLSSQEVADNGSMTIDLDNLNHGVYIISTESITFKIIKQ